MNNFFVFLFLSVTERHTEAVNTAVYLRNRNPTTALKETTPYECLFKRKPDVANLKVFGCLSLVHIPDNQRKKLEAKSRKAIFVGYPDNVKGYKLYDPVSSKFIRSRDVVFLEGKFMNLELISPPNRLLIVHKTLMYV